MAQVITVVNKSGKIVKSTRTLAGVFNEAKSAYSERKAELKAARLKERDLQEQAAKAAREQQGGSLCLHAMTDHMAREATAIAL
jgi:Sec-independent protein translocase protein TatA